MILEEQPAKVSEAVGLFVQGLGYVFRPRKARSTQGTPVKEKPPPTAALLMQQPQEPLKPEQLQQQG
jgi:hypothetical protein